MQKLLLGAFVLLLSCGGTEKDDTSGDGGDEGGDDGGGSVEPDDVSVDGGCAQDVRWGTFTVDASPDYAVVDGEVLDGVVPTDVLTEIITVGDCTIWRRENPFCDPACAPGETCDLSGSCVTYPQSQDLGTVSIQGLSSAVAMSPVEPGNTYFDTSLTNPPWTSGDPLSLTTGGGVYESVTMHGIAPDDLSLGATTWELVPGQDFALTWNSPSTDATTEVRLELRIDQHGATPASLECIFPDTGSGLVSADTLDELIDAGLTGFPAGALSRRTIDHADIGAGGCMELVASSSRYPELVDIQGYTPCRTDADCPDGQTCNEELERCEDE